VSNETYRDLQIAIIVALGLMLLITWIRLLPETYADDKSPGLHDELGRNAQPSDPINYSGGWGG
jgi:hypothetical protein